ncbi:MAG: glycoside hydrolase family 127 protein, partial [Lachnospiraceae bacterium]|nr:glycoside hydrolase family 127 protein [Lachnospiraceae bacterium]
MRDIRVNVKDTFFNGYKDLVRSKMLPYQWKVLNDDIDINIERERDDEGIPNEKSHAIENLKIAAGLSSGKHYGWVFQDSDVYKWLEAAAYTLKNSPDEDLKKITDDVIDLIAKAQEPDGYIGTYFTIMEPERRFKRLVESHELYSMGHLLEACVALNIATGNTKALEVAEKVCDCIDKNFGPEDGKIHGADGHEEVEIGLMKMYHFTGNEKYLKLADYFLRIRGEDPNFYKDQLIKDGGAPIINGMQNVRPPYLQAHLPVVNQYTAEGHAVRAVYLCTALADLASATKDEDITYACKRLWNNITRKRMYITGGIGSTVHGEAFTLDYDLPNDTMYCETCASIGLIFFAKKMLEVEPKGEYADVMEKALYNTALSGMALDGKHFFYVNPLEVVPEKSKKDPGKSHVKVVRPEWLGCACCPPNLARLIASVEDYIYSALSDRILVNLFVSSDINIKDEKRDITITQKTDYPRSGKISFEIENRGEDPVKVGIRVPYYTDKANASVNGLGAALVSQNGYFYVTAGKGTTNVEYELEIIPKRWYANPKVSSDTGKVAIARGPVVYCLEGV